MPTAALVVKLSWYLLVGMLLMAWFVGMLTMAMATALGAALLELYFEWGRKRSERRRKGEESYPLEDSDQP